MGACRCGITLDSSRVGAANEKDVELNTRREISYLQATIYYYYFFFFYQTNKITLYRQNDLGLRMVKASPFIHQPGRGARKVSDVSAADWR